MIPDPSGYRAPVGGRGRILIPGSINRVAGGLWIGAACTTPGLALDWLLGTTTRFSARLASRPAPVPKLPNIDWSRWSADSVPVEIADGALYIVALPRDARRHRFQLAIADDSGRVKAFAKFTRNPPTELAREVRSRLRLQRFEAFETPKPISEGEVDGWYFNLDEALTHGFHRPAALRPPQKRELINEYQAAFGDLVPSPQRLAHGDFGPWNVRVTAGDRVLVFDWEDVVAGPEGADELWHSVNEALLTRGRRLRQGSIRAGLSHYTDQDVEAAAHFWLNMLDRPEPAEVAGQSVRGHGADLLARQRQALLALTESSLAR